MSRIDPARPILVYLANGVQGGALARAALRQGLKVRALVRDVGKAYGLSKLGAEVVEADLSDLGALKRASVGAGHAVIQIPPAGAEEMQALAAHAIEASQEAGLASIVLRLASASRRAPCPEPSFVANAGVEDMIRRSALPFAIVRPTLYLDNLLKPSALHDIRTSGLFEPPLAAELPISWTSAQDCADATLHILARGVDGGDHRIAGRESLTGPALAARLSTGLGRAITYRAQSLDIFEREAEDALGAVSARFVASKFRFLATHPLDAEAILSRPFEPCGALAGFEPMSVEAWAARHQEVFKPQV